MMDFSKFSDDSFDVKDWVNAAFRAQRDSPGNKDAHAATLVMKLQLFIQEVNNSLEEISQQALTNLPRVIRETEAVRQEAIFLKEQMMMVKEDIRKVEENTAHSMKVLVELDAIKSRIQSMSVALEEADNWTKLSADVEEVFQSQDVHAISSQLVKMQKSLKMLSDTADYEDRCSHLEGLKNRLEAVVSPQLVAAFNSHNLESAQTYVRIFSDIERLQNLQSYYFKCHKATLLQSWQDIVNIDPNQSLQDTLPKLYDQLLSTWQSEVQWCNQVFSEPVNVTATLVIQVLYSLEPSLPACIQAALEDTPSQLNTLISLRQITMRFAKSIEASLEKTSGTYNEDVITQLVRTIHSPYLPYLLQYSTLQEQHLNDQLRTVHLETEQQEVIDCVRLMGQSVSKLYSIANSAVEQCMAFTSGCGVCGLQKALTAYFTVYTSEFIRVLQALRVKCNIDEVKVSSGEIKEDWTLFQHALRILQTCGDLLLHQRDFQDQLCVAVLEHTEALQDSSTQEKPSRFQHYNYLSVDSPTEYDLLMGTVTGLREGLVEDLLCDVTEAVQKLNEHAHKFAFDIVFCQLQQQLANVHSMEIWGSDAAGGEVLPSFSLSPMEYITKIGQYLMTLPQQLEPFHHQDNPALEAALQAGKLPYQDKNETHEVDHVADFWLGSIARGTMLTYLEAILKIPKMTDYGRKQLAADIDYVCNVLDALGVPANKDLKGVAALLQASSTEFDDVSKDCPPKVVNIVKAMRMV
ncbi:COG7 [Branchiostoma lanceolatum]|uniref:Conserved oligomeric Golgi complex subunit 7 n=1 Tax=Branchiostoma lanceolatum TaxID=7740 RepID=A0A8J9ZUH9_BRALA|nr:COG7 [Branchiostoma lanceolatum]